MSARLLVSRLPLVAHTVSVTQRQTCTKHWTETQLKHGYADAGTPLKTLFCHNISNTCRVIIIVLTHSSFPSSVDFPSGCYKLTPLSSSHCLSGWLAVHDGKTDTVTPLCKERFWHSLFLLLFLFVQYLWNYFRDVLQRLFDGIFCHVPLESCDVSHKIN